MTTDRFAKNLTPPYYAVIFTSQRSKTDDEGYGKTADRMVELAATMPGFLGVESARDGTGLGITVSYWKDEQSIADWKANAEHANARATGNKVWYDHYQLRVAKIDRAYDGPR